MGLGSSERPGSRLADDGLGTLVRERDLLDAVGQALIVTDPAGTVAYWNGTAEELFGWTAEEAIGRTIVDLVPTAASVDDLFALVSRLGAGDSWSGDLSVQRRDGTPILAFFTFTTVWNADGEVIAVIAVSHDVTQRRSLERQLGNLAERLQLALGAGRMGTWSWDLASGRVSWDPAMEVLYGLEPGTFGGTIEDYLALIHPDDRQQVANGALASADTANPLTHEHRVVWPDGTEHWIEGRGNAIRDERGDIVGLVGVGIDIDDRKRLEAALLEAQALRTKIEMGRELDEQRHAVRVLNEVLIRPEFPSVPGIELGARYLPGDNTTGIGGDWYDAFLLPTGALLLAVGDVTGHGIPAARLMAKLRHATRAYGCQGLGPAEIVAGLDRFVEHFAIDAQYATVQLALLERATGRVQIASAGHPPAVLVTADHTELVELRGGHLLGLGRPDSAAETELVLDSGNALLLYTDGLIERRDEPIDDGLQRLVKAVEAFDTTRGAAALRDLALDKCLAGTTNLDDICILAAVRTSGP